MDSFDIHFKDFKETIENLIVKDVSQAIPETVDRLFMAIANINRESMTEKQDEQVEEMAINLWNWAVFRGMGLDISQEQKAKVRHIACKLLWMCEGPDDLEEVIHRRILMTVKTGKAWLGVGNAMIADEFFQTALADLETFFAKIMEMSSTETETLQKHAVERHIFKVFSYQAESAFIQGDFQRASLCVLRCKEMLIRFPEMIQYLLTLCYNFGVETHRVNKYEESCFWLSQSYDIGKMFKNFIEPETLAKVLRFLATVYLDWDCREYFDKALNTADLANKEHLDPDGLSLKIKILSKGKASNERLLEAAIQILHLDMSLDFYLRIAKLMMDYEREFVAFRFMRFTCDRFKSSENIGKALVLHIDMLLERDEELLAGEKIEEVIIGQKTGRRLETEAVSCLHNILWKKAFKSFKEQNYEDALQWYIYSLRIYQSDQIDKEFVKLKRNIASCYLHLKQLDKAKEIVTEAEQLEPASIFTQFYLFKIAVTEGNSDTALETLNALENFFAVNEPEENDPFIESESPAKLFSLSAQFALENGQGIAGEKALEYLAQYAQQPQQVFISLKCLFRLLVPKVSEMPESESKKEEMKRLVTCLNTALLKFPQPFVREDTTSDTSINEVHWFRKITWNLAIQCNSDPMIMREFFILSYKLSQFCPSDQVILVAQKTCLLMAVAVDLEQARTASTALEKANFLDSALKQICKCKDIWNHLKETGYFASDPCEALLMLYEFEVKVKTNDPSLESLWESLWEIPDLDCKTLETIASLAMEQPAQHSYIAMKALNRALLLYRRRESVNVLRFSEGMHSLASLLLPQGVPDTDLCSLEEICGYFEEALRFITLNEEYPEMEIVWLMITSWNCGIYMFGQKQYVFAEKWCSLAFHFLNRLHFLKNAYENQMNILYGEMMEAINKMNGSVFHEE